MLTLPKIVDRAAQPYVGITESVPMDGIPAMADKNFPALMDWMKANGHEPTGASFFRYHVIDMEGLLILEVGVPTREKLTGDETVKPGELPAGRYGTATWTGPFDALIEVNTVLIGWAKQKGLAWDVAEKPDGDHFGCRLEIYETDPAEEPDTSKWVTEVAIKLAEPA